MIWLKKIEIHNHKGHICYIREVCVSNKDRFADMAAILIENFWRKIAPWASHNSYLKQ